MFSALLANSPTLHQQIKIWFDSAKAIGFKGIEYSYEQRVETGHNRKENRQFFAVSISEMGELYQKNNGQDLKQ